MMQIINIEKYKKFTAIFKGFNAVISYRIDEDWFSVYYYKDEEFIMKDVRKASSEQQIIKTIQIAINSFLKFEPIVNHNEPKDFDEFKSLIT